MNETATIGDSRKAIEKWMANAEKPFAEIDITWKSCPYCLKFINSLCIPCPIRCIITHRNCEKTPYSKISEKYAIMKSFKVSPNISFFYIDPCVREVLFLQWIEWIYFAGRKNSGTKP